MPRSKTKQYLAATQRVTAHCVGKESADTATAYIAALGLNATQLRWTSATAAILSEIARMCLQLEQTPVEDRVKWVQQMMATAKWHRLGRELSIADFELDILDTFGADKGGAPLKTEASFVDLELLRDVEATRQYWQSRWSVQRACTRLVEKNPRYEGIAVDTLRQRHKRATARKRLMCT